MHFIHVRKDFLLIFAIGSLPMWPVLLLGIQTVYEVTIAEHRSLIPDQLLHAASNSLAIGLIAAAVGALIAVRLSAAPESLPALILLILMLLFIPGSVVATGYIFIDGVLTRWNPTLPFHAMLLITALVGYILPYQALICIFGQMAIGRTERSATFEYMTHGQQFRYCTRRIAPSIITALLAGLFLAATEVPRTRVLATDIFGWGKQTLGPLVIGRMQTGGFTAMYFVAATILFLAAVLTFVGIQRSLSRY